MLVALRFILVIDSTAEGGEVEIALPPVCSSNSVVDIIFHRHPQPRGII